jgi:Ca2+-binding RTX toxin-like protein
LSLSDATKILDAASSEPAASLETLLDSLRKLYWKADDKTPAGDAGDSATTRVAYHENLDFLRRRLQDGALLGGEIISLVGQAPAEVGAQAAEDDDNGLAVRYALMALNPFAIVGADYSLHNENSELDLYDEETDEGTLTENWLKDRAAMLSAKIAVNTTDSNLSSPAYFKDIATNTVLGSNLFGAARRTVFGGEGSDALEGGFNEDRLYGGAGGDTIEGGWRTDYIEGNAGDDTLNGDSGDDEIRGGAGKDTIDGGADADKLYGGSGEDNIKGGKGEDRIEGNADKDKLYGDDGADTLLGGAGDDYIVGGEGSDRLSGGEDDDVLYGGAAGADDTSDSGNDTLEGGSGADKLYGSAGKDVLQGGAGDDKLRGGASAADYMVGGAGSDTYIYKSEDQADLIYDEDGQGHIEYDGATLSGGRGRGKNSRVFFDNPDNPDYTYSVSGDMDAGPVTLTIKRNKDSRGQLTVFDFYDGDLGIHLKDGDEDKAPRYKRPPPPPQDPGRQNRGDPLVIDLAGTGLSTYGLERNLHFDHDQDRFAEKTGWIAAGSGVLVLDANPSTGSGQAGVLDNGQELFGDFTRLPGGQLAANGFAALSQYDRNRDGRIDAGDPIWSSLKVAVWETDPRGETVLGDPAAAMSLKTLEELGIASIGLDSSIATVTDENGNTRTRSGTVTLADGTTRELAEYRFARDTAETTFLDWRDLPEEIAVLPELTLGGIRRNCLNYGEVPTCTC